tara:strand:- start:1396 stop:2307 length:912 start_codon:yes stop_codon:yes gene_type:complete
MTGFRQLLVVAFLLPGAIPLMAQDAPAKNKPPGLTIAIDADVVYGHKLGLALTYDVLQPGSGRNRAGVMFMVSGGWVSRWGPPEGAIERFRHLLEAGYTVFLVRHGSSPKFLVPECVDDVRLAIRHVRSNAKRFDIDSDRIGVTGGSAGGHLALMLGTTGEDANPRARDPLQKHSSRANAVVAFFPPTDLSKYLDPKLGFLEAFPALKFDPRQSPAVSPLLQVSSDDAPSLMIHGDMDKLVPLFHSQAIHKALGEKKVPSELMVIEGAAHGFKPDDQKRADAASLRWFNRHLLDSAKAPTSKK